MSQIVDRRFRRVRDRASFKEKYAAPTVPPGRSYQAHAELPEGRAYGKKVMVAIPTVVPGKEFPLPAGLVGEVLPYNAEEWSKVQCPDDMTLVTFYRRGTIAIRKKNLRLAD